MHTTTVHRAAILIGRPRVLAMPVNVERSAIDNYMQVALGFGTCAIFLRADLGIAFSTGVSAWADQSGGAHDPVQAVGASQPAFSATAANGRPAILPDGVDDDMLVTFSRATPRTTYVVGKWDTAADPGGMVDGDTVNTNRIYRVDATTLSLGNGGGGGGVGGVQTTNLHCHVFNHTAAGTSSYYKQETGATSTLDAGATAPDGLTLGGLGVPGFYADCTIAEVADYSVTHVDGSNVQRRLLLCAAARYVL